MYTFLFEIRGGSTCRECSMERAIEIARQRVIDTGSEVVLKVLNPKTRKFIRLGIYMPGEVKTYFNSQTKETIIYNQVELIPDLPRKVRF